MRTIVCNALTGIDGLALGELPDPGAPGAGEVRIRIAAAGLNYADLLVTQGKYQVKHEPPFVPGFQAAGTIEAVGPQVTQVKAGDRVIAIPEAGAFADSAIVSADRVYPAPPGLMRRKPLAFPSPTAPPMSRWSSRPSCSPARSCWCTGRPAASD